MGTRSKNKGAIRIVQELNIGNLSKSSRRTKDKDQFIELLQSQSNSLRVLSIIKARQQHLLPVDGILKYKGNKDLEKFGSSLHLKLSLSRF